MTSKHIETIAILGSGSVGAALGQSFSSAGHTVIFGVRAPTATAQRTIGEAVAASDVLVLAVPFDAIRDVAKAAGDCAGKLLIDCTNPVAMVDGRLSLTLGFTTSGGEQVAAAFPQANVVKAFNQTGAENMGAAGNFAERPCMFVAGDDAAAVARASALVADTGFEPVGAGPLINARLLDPLAMLWIDQALFRGAGRDFAFVRARRKP